ncbi:MAG: ABC transporter permease [Pedosphaera sp.]|jgi:oligopeptide transport system permease protein|nr:ABC transporter permease [Pedosphaera sp.]|tara:strand:- start:314 stop:1246 length:933 start_codon:yes stop_codon:yes gene_type:complete
MFVFILRRILETIPVLLCVAAMTFFMCRLAPGGPFDDDKQVTAEVREQLNKQFNLDKPLYVQFYQYLVNLPKLQSFKYPNRTVGDIIKQKFPVSFKLGFFAITIALGIGVLFGVIASLKPNSFIDYIPSSLAMIGICLPTFVMGPILMYIFALKLKLLPATGWGGFDGDAIFHADMILPSLTLGLFYAAYISRLTRGGMLDILTQDYIRTAKAKGASGLRVIVKHAMRGGLLPVISFMGPAVAGLIAGSFVIETIFNIPGLGKDFVQSAFNRDYTLVLGVVMFYATLIVLLNLVVDILQVTLNPKLKFNS